MADVGPTTRKPVWRYVVGAALCLATVGVGAYLYLYDGQAAQTEAQAPAAKPAVAAAKRAVPDDEPPVLSSIMIDQARELVGEARRLAASGDFAGAEIALKKAEQAAPGVEETAQARRAIAELNTPQGQLAAQLDRARSALDLGDNAAARHDFATANRALNEAARIDIQNPDVLKARDELHREQDSVQAAAKN